MGGGLFAKPLCGQINYMKKEHLPKWIKIKQNGTLAEARARSFLLERFWILERSIDVDGIDFIIQRRITERNIGDREPPRYGKVQVKFFESENTTQYLHKEYILNEDEKHEFIENLEVLKSNGLTQERGGKVSLTLKGMTLENEVILKLIRSCS